MVSKVCTHPHIYSLLILTVTGYTVTRFLASPTADNPLAPPTYTIQSTLEFESIDQVKEAFAQAGQKVSSPRGSTIYG